MISFLEGAEVLNHVELGEVGAIDPSTSLLDEIRDSGGWVRDSGGSWDEGQFVFLALMGQNFKTHDSILCEVHVGHEAVVLFLFKTFEVLTEGLPLDRAHTEGGERPWQHRDETEELLRHFIEVVGDFVLEVLPIYHEEGCKRSGRGIDLDLTAGSSTIRVGVHVLH